MSEFDFGDVETLLDSDLENFEHELGELYDNMEYYAEVADALDSAGREDDAEYFQELAVDAYSSFSNVIQLKKLPEEVDDYSELAE